MSLHIACSTDSKYVQHCMAMLCSLFENNSEQDFHVHMLHHDLPSADQQLIATLVGRYQNKVTFYDIDDTIFCDIKPSPEHPDLSIATFYRILLASLIDASIHRILYIDCDIIILDDITPLYNIDLTDYALAAVRDCTPINDAHRQIMNLPLDGKAFCAGFMMINLDYWRQNDSQDSMLQFAVNNKDFLLFEDQDILNHEFRYHWYELPHKYGYTPLSIVPLDENQRWPDIQEYIHHPVIIHYSSYIKPWLDITIPDGHHYWKYAAISGYPSPSKTVTSSSLRRKIHIAKIRYYINKYIHPFIPNFIEIPLLDIYHILKSICLIPFSNRFEEYRTKLWMDKYK